MAGVTLVQALAYTAKGIMDLAVAGQVAAESFRDAAAAKREYAVAGGGEVTSSMSRATGGGASTMGSSSGAPDGNAGMSKAVTAAGLKAALAVTRKRTS